MRARMKSYQKKPIYTPFANNTNNDINGMTDAVTATLIKHVENGRNVALISPRRLGKSGLKLLCVPRFRNAKTPHLSLRGLSVMS